MAVSQPKTLSLLITDSFIPVDCKNLAPIWDQVANDFISDDKVVIAKVDADAANGKATAKAHGVSSYPTIKFFPAGSKESVDYEGGRKEADFLAYINEKVGTHRLPGGDLDNAAGTIEALDTIVAKLTGSNLAELSKEIKKQAETFKTTAQLKYAEYYVRVFDKLASNNGYAAKEVARLDNILSKGGLSPSKRDEIKSKTNVLRKFVEKLAEEIKSVKDEL